MYIQNNAALNITILGLFGLLMIMNVYAGEWADYYALGRVGPSMNKEHH